MGFLTWIIVGLIAGWLAGQVMKGGGYGILVDIILGILGGLLGGWLFGHLGIWPGGDVVGSIIVAFIGALAIAAPDGHSPQSAARTSAVPSRATRSKRKGDRLTPAGRKRLSQLMKKRWAERRKKGSKA
jgi:uncharacterized membrane protein YeaQ/YmgE (transglycosylase-associated protein family)